MNTQYQCCEQLEDQILYDRKCRAELLEEEQENAYWEEVATRQLDVLCGYQAPQ